MGDNNIVIYLTSTNQAAIIAAEARISSNCEFPNGRGTNRWAEVQKAANEDLWLIPKPPANGYSDSIQAFTQEQMLDGVDLNKIIEQELNLAWLLMGE